MKEAIRELVLSCGADLCGFAHIDRFSGAPSGYKPTDIFPACRAVISFAVALPKGLAQVDPRIIYGHYNDMSAHRADDIAFESARRIEERFACSAVPLPCDNPYEYWDREKMEGRGLLSMKHAAVLAGLGSLGKNTLLMNQSYGNMLTLGAILTDCDLPSDRPSESLCIDGCRRCVDACPVGAIDHGEVNQKLCRGKAYGKTERGFDTVDCNRCRTACPVNRVK